MVSKDFQGYKKNPAYQMMSDALGRMNTIGKELGLSPKARNQLMDLKNIDNNDKSIGQSLKKFFE